MGLGGIGRAAHQLVQRRQHLRLSLLTERPGQEDSANDTAASPQMKAALQRFIDDFSQHSRKNSELIDVLIQALKGVNQELQQ